MVITVSRVLVCIHRSIWSIWLKQPVLLASVEKVKQVLYPWYLVQYLIFLCLAPLHHYTITPLHHYTITPYTICDDHIYHYPVTPFAPEKIIRSLYLARQVRPSCPASARSFSKLKLNLMYICSRIKPL